MSGSELLFLHDGNGAALRLGRMLAAVLAVEALDLRRAALPPASRHSGAVVCLHHSMLRKFDSVRTAAGLSVAHIVFVMPEASQAYAPVLRKMGVSDYFIAPVDPHVLWRAVCEARSDAVEASWQDLPGPQRDALAASRQTFRKLFDGLRGGLSPDLVDLERTSTTLCNAARSEPLSSWLASLKHHHDYTYRHSMFVCEILLHFAWDMGVRSNDLTLLAMGGLLHDIGKARVSPAILDKPSPLTDAERETMRRHPSFSREIVARMTDIDPRIARMAVHHHERLDGAGYPDGLRGAEIDDLTRLLTITDIYSALIDDRMYKVALSSEKSFFLMEQARGHIDLDMLARFKSFVLDSRPAGDGDA